MNIFVTSSNALEASRDLDDVRLRKMILETAQMVSTAFRVGWGIDTTYRPTHRNHPCNVWARENTGNLFWLIDYGLLLHEEYKFRFSKTHKSGLELESLDALFNEQFKEEILDETPFANCARRQDMNLDFTHLPVIPAYRAYLNARWERDRPGTVKWTKRGPPVWSTFDCTRNLVSV